MRLSIAIRSSTARSWTELLGDPPKGWRIEERADELAFYQADEPATGLRLSGETGSHRVEVPAFAGTAELATAHGLVSQIVQLVGGSIEIGGQRLPLEQIDDAFAQHVVPKFATACTDLLLRLVGTPGEVFPVEGVRRPYYLGQQTARRAVSLAADGDLYSQIAEEVARMQALAAPTVFPNPLRIRTDGAIETYAVWIPGDETLLPACDYVLVSQPDGDKVRVARAAIGELVTLPGETAVRGVRLDELQWLMGDQDDETAQRLFDHAADLGQRMKRRA